MPSSCPKCRRVVEEDEICCAQVRYTWRCKSCFKLTSGFAIPYGKCFLCGGDLEVIRDRELGDSMRFQAIRDAIQFELLNAARESGLYQRAVNTVRSRSRSLDAFKEAHLFRMGALPARLTFRPFVALLLRWFKPHLFERMNGVDGS